ncbi:alpha/beta fold hydrolase [bacterium]|nr:alpha/beta fold hydrolase [bacterium]
MYRASDGYPLFYRHWKPVGPARGIIVAVHGIQSHSGWYQRSSSAYAAAGFEVYFLDRRGSGMNFRQRGHAAHEARLLADVRQFLSELKWSRRNFPAVPLILMGVSWGGKLAASYAATYPDDINGLALFYPGLNSRLRPSRWQQWKLQSASQAGWGHITAPIPLNEPHLFTDSAHWQDFIRRDELALHRVSVDFLLSNLRLSTLLKDRMAEIRCPTLMLLAGRDDIVDNTANRQSLQQIRKSTVEIIEYPTARHTLEFEPQPETFIGDALGWLNHLPNVRPQ